MQKFPDMWHFNLPIILLVLRTIMKEDFPLSPAELVYGQDLRLPCEFKTQNMPSVLQRQNLVQHLKNFISDLKPVPPRVHSEVSTYLDKQLQHCKMVLVRNDAVQPPLSPRFSGPFEVIKRCDKYFVLKDSNNGSEKSVSVDRLKVFHTAPESPFDEAISVEPSTEEKIAPTHDDDDSTPEQAAKSSDQVRTRYGRVVKTPQRFTM